MKIATVLLCATVSAACLAADKPAFYELRVYHAPEGKLPELLKRFRDHTLKLFEKHGITNIGYWTPLEEKDGAKSTLVYLLGYPSAAARETSWKNFLADADWKKAHKESEVNGKLVEKIESIYLAPTAYSMFDFAPAETARLFELRTYTTPAGKLDALHNRFSGHTLELFKKHGMSNIIYMTPTREKDGMGTKLIYFIAHKDKAARDASFAAFRADPVWTKAKSESEKDGSLTVENGVVSLLLVPVDFSTLK